MPFFGVPIRNGLPIGLGSVAGFGVQQFDPSQLFAAGEQGFLYDPSDLSTLFQDSAGTTPVTGVEQVVGLMLDKRNPSYSVLFSAASLSTPNSVDLQLGSTYTVECWAYRTGTGANIRIFSDGSNTANNVDIYIATTTNNVGFFGGLTTSTYALQQNVWTHLALVVTAGVPAFYADGVAQTLSGTLTGVNSTATTTRHVGSLAGSYVFQGYISNLRIVKGAAVYTGNFTPPTAPLTAISGTSLLTCGNSWSGNPAITNNGAIANKLNPFNTGTGNHATSTGAARPTLSKRYNLLTYSEEFDQGVWGKFGLNTTGTPAWVNVAVAPDGTNTADLLLDTTSNAEHYAQQVFFVTGGASYTFSGYIKQYTYTTCVIRTWLVNSVIHNVDFVAGTMSNGGTLTPVGNGWYRFEVTRTASGSGAAYIESYVKQSSSYAGTGTDGHYAWGFQLLTAADVTATGNAYQRIAAATSYDTSNSVFRPYLAFGGTQAMSTGSINFTATDKMTVWAGVTKLSEGNALILTELGNLNSNVNGFNLATNTTAANGYASGLVITTGAYPGFRYTPYNAPITNVLLSAYDRNGVTVADQIQSKINAISVAGTSIGQPPVAASTFGNLPLFIGARNLASLFLNGRLYSLITRGAQSTAAEISATESWVNQRTGAY